MCYTVINKNKRGIIMDYKVVPVVVIKELQDTIPTLQALCDGNLPVAEITFRTACAEEAIKLGVEKFPDMYIGAGTVINKEQAIKAINAGAKFIVSPGLSEEVALYHQGRSAGMLSLWPVGQAPQGLRPHSVHLRYHRQACGRLLYPARRRSVG